MTKLSIVNRPTIVCPTNDTVTSITVCNGRDGTMSRCKYYGGCRYRGDMEVECYYPEECCVNCHWGMIYPNLECVEYKVYLCCYGYIPKQMVADVYKTKPNWCPGYKNGGSD